MFVQCILLYKLQLSVFLDPFLFSIFDVEDAKFKVSQKPRQYIVFRECPVPGRISPVNSGKEVIPAS
jgi:hypothetical protein